MSSPEDNKKIVLEYFELFFNQHRIDDAVDTYQSPRYIQHNPALPNGPEALKDTMKSLIAQFPKLRFDVKRAFAEGDYVIVHSEMTGLNWILGGAEAPTAGSSDGEMPSYAVVDILRMADGR